jgi:two-component system, OmpR family, response regulator
MKVLIVEDDKNIVAYLVRGLREAGHGTDCAATGHDGLMMASGGAYDVLVIDRMLPELDGIGLVRALREMGQKTPVLFLTALARVDQRVEGFNAGGDDYLVKPFAFSEFLARVTALARRPPIASNEPELRCGHLVLDRLKRTVVVDGQLIDLQPREFFVLEYLLLHKGEVVTRTMLLEKIWDFHFDPRTNVVETLVSRMRAKLGTAKNLIHTIRGAGYVARD